MSRRRSGSMEDLPEDVLVDIISRLPVKRIIHCKSVCKNWRNLISESHFVNLHMSRSPDCLLFYHSNSNGSPNPWILKLVELQDQLNHNRLLRKPIMSLDINIAHLLLESRVIQVGSVNGLICLPEIGKAYNNIYICNPITKEYIILPKHHFVAESYLNVKYGFGFSMAGEYKVVRICISLLKPINIEVYTLGTDQWRNLAEIPYSFNRIDVLHGVFCNGHLHWVICGQLFAFNLDNETFHPFPSYGEEEHKTYGRIAVLKGCLSLLSRSGFGSTDCGLTVWVMKEHGIKKSWHKEFEIKESISRFLEFDRWVPLCIVVGLNGKSILMLRTGEKRQLVAYCLETNTIQDTNISDTLISVGTYRPSFLKLHNFQSATVHTF